MDLESLKRLALAVVIKAVEDWRYLCRGGKESGNCNWKELEHFFENDCATYLSGTTLSEKTIYEKLKHERAAANRREKHC